MAPQKVFAPRKVFSGALALIVAAFWAAAAPAASRDELKTFLEVTGFDVAITSMQQGAMAGPGIAGEAPSDFGQQYAILAEKVFDPEMMLDRALDMMEAIMPDDLVVFGQDFYATELGQRLVVAENESHMTDDDIRYAEGEDILAELAETSPGRIDDYRAMSEAIGGIDSSIRAITEIQVRYLMAAQAAGTGESSYSEEELRALIAEDEPQVRQNMAVYGLLGSSWAYRDFSDEDVKAYRAVLEDPRMGQVYEILNAIQYEIMAERYAALATELAKLAPQVEL